MVMVDVGTPKMAREHFAVIQTIVAQEDIFQQNVPAQNMISNVLEQLDAHRPLGIDGKHGDLHTDTCGCEGHEGLRSAPVVALTPLTGTLLYHAWYAEDSRKRHEKEFWFGQAERDIRNRELWRSKAIANGVPEHQADAYIYSGSMADPV